MKTFLFLLSGIVLFSNTFAQSVKISSNVGKIANNAQIVSQGAGLSAKAPYQFAVAFHPNYVTKGVALQELSKKQILEYKLELDSIVRPTISKNSKKIKFATIRVTGTQYTVKGTPVYVAENEKELEDAKFSAPIRTDLADWGFNIIGVNSSTIFKEKEKTADLLIAAEITHLGFGTRGAGLQYGLLINWSVFDVLKEQVIYKVTTAGYSDTGALGLGEEYSLAIRNALIGLMTDKEFIKICTSDSYGDSPDIVLTETLKLAKLPQTKFTSYENMIEASQKSVVTIKTEYGHGSGFVINANGYVLTNSHVIKGSEKIEAIFSNGLTLPVTLISENKKRDVALLKIVGGGYTSLPVSLGEDGNKAGTEVIAIGTPEDIKLGQTVTKGIISGNRSLDDQSYIQTDVSLNSGNSGGPLLNNKGEVLGIVVSKVKGSGIEGLGFAIPIGSALKALNIQFE